MTPASGARWGRQAGPRPVPFGARLGTWSGPPPASLRGVVDCRPAGRRSPSWASAPPSCTGASPEAWWFLNAAVWESVEAFATPSGIGVPSHLHPVPGAHGGRTAPVPRRSLCRASVWIGSPADARRAPRLCRGDPAESAVDRGSLVRPSGYRGGRDDCQRPPCRPGRQGLPGDGMAVSPAALVVRWTALAERAGSRRRSDGPSGPHEGHHSDGGSARFVPR